MFHRGHRSRFRLAPVEVEKPDRPDPRQHSRIGVGFRRQSGVVMSLTSSRATLQTSGTFPETVRYAIKSSFLFSFPDSVPSCAFASGLSLPFPGRPRLNIAARS